MANVVGDIRKRNGSYDVLFAALLASAEGKLH
jgi:hypothetical protein